MIIIRKTLGAVAAIAALTGIFAANVALAEIAPAYNNILTAATNAVVTSAIDA